ncbi:diguanylate cyclase domain-containing protein [Thiorhodococcus fuscus]|uniref:diguanylate cyclase n=1 Tax=Thiorhodococcus fuscus TaxID=527200 RepID=A0ABW4YAM2_9GAMM
MDRAANVQLIDQLQTGVVLLDDRGCILSWNAWMTRHSGIAPEDVAGRPIEDVFTEMKHSRLLNCIQQALRFRLSSVLTPGLNPSVLPLYQKPGDRELNQRMQQLVYVTPICGDPYACLIQIQDMTATVRRERRLRAQSSQLIATTYRDSLTGVGNRRRFDQDLSERFREARSRQIHIALLMIDVDDFKAFNDRFGHQKGDEGLIMVASALQEGLRQEGDCISRYGGEEFALTLLGADQEAACAVAERLRLRVEGLRLRHPTSRTARHVTVSIGISAVVPSLELPPQTLVSQADLALYTAKDRGRNRCMCFDHTVTEVRACV